MKAPPTIEICWCGHPMKPVGNGGYECPSCGAMRDVFEEAGQRRIIKIEGKEATFRREP